MPTSYKTEPRAPKDNKTPFSILENEETEYNAQYKLCAGSHTQISQATSGWNQLGSFPIQLASGWDVPRSMSTLLDPPLVASYRRSVSEHLCENEIPSQNIAPKHEKNKRQEPRTHQKTGKSGAKELKTKPSDNERHAKDIEQNAQNIQHIPVAEYRQNNMSQYTKDDAETDEERSQDPNSNEPKGDN